MPLSTVSNSPEVYGAAYRDSAHIKKYWVECEYLDPDSYYYSCLDVQKIMSSSKVQWNASLCQQSFEVSQIFSERPSVLMRPRRQRGFL
jgi:hypothetical protein